MVSWPQFCNTTKFNLTTLNTIKKSLEIYWTDFHNPINFWKHEYYKHASCAKKDILLNTEFLYFDKTLEMRKKYDLYKILSDNNIYPSNHKKYSISLFKNLFKKIFKFNPIITCNKNNILTEIQLCLNFNLNIINCPNDKFMNKCHDNIWYNKIVNYYP